MSEKKELSLDELDAVSGGIDIGSSETAGPDLDLPAGDLDGLKMYCDMYDISEDAKVTAKTMLENGEAVTFHYDGATGKYIIK